MGFDSASLFFDDAYFIVLEPSQLYYSSHSSVVVPFPCTHLLILHPQNANKNGVLFPTPTPLSTRNLAHETRKTAATAGVVRAVGAQGSIIGPTHAISAALTTLKGAARRVRKASSSSSSGHRGTGDAGNGGGGGNGNGRGEVKEAMAREDAVEEEEDGEDGGGNGGTAAGEADAAVGGEGGRGPGETAGGGYGSGSAEAVMRGGGAPAAAGGADAAVGEWTGSVFGQEAGRYGELLEAMVRGAVEVRRAFCGCACVCPCVRSFSHRCR